MKSTSPKISLPGRVFHFLCGPNPLHPKIWEGRLKPMTFRCFEPNDLAQCYPLYTLNQPDRLPAKDTTYERLLRERTACTLVALENGEIIATGSIQYQSSCAATLCYGLVHPEFQSKGIGTALVLARLALLKPSEPNYRILIFAVEKSIGFYHRFGFHEFGRWKDEHGQHHPAACLHITASEILKCRKLLAAHSISFPLNEDLVPLITYPAESNSSLSEEVTNPELS